MPEFKSMWPTGRALNQESQNHVATNTVVSVWKCLTLHSFDVAIRHNDLNPTNLAEKNAVELTSEKRAVEHQGNFRGAGLM